MLGGHDKNFSEEKHHPAKLMYPDGCYVSRHPGHDEIYAHYAFWMAHCSKEQMEVLDGMRDMQIFKMYREGPPKLQTLTPEEAVMRAIKFWYAYYPLEVKDFMTYIDMQKELAFSAKGYDKTKVLKLIGAIPQAINHMMRVYNPEITMTIPGDRYPLGHKIFYRLFTKARIGGM